MKIFIASLVISLLAVLAGDKAEHRSEFLYRKAINLPPADTPVPSKPSGEKQRVVDGSDIPLNPLAAPDSLGRAVYRDPERQSELEWARLYEQIAPLARRAAWYAPLAGLALFVALRIRCRMVSQDEPPEDEGEIAAGADKAGDQAQETAAESVTEAVNRSKGGA